MALAWKPWSSVSQGRTLPGSLVNFVYNELVISDPGGAIYACPVPLNLKSGEWKWVEEGRSIPGAPVTFSFYTIAGGLRYVIFITDLSGAVYGIAGTPTLTGFNWDGNWQKISQGTTSPGSAVHAISIGSAQIELFMTDQNGVVRTSTGSPSIGWTPEWTSVSDGSAHPGSPVTPLIYNSLLNLFIADPSGAIYTISKDSNGSWGGWSWVSQGRATPGATVAAIAYQAGSIPNGPACLFISDPRGGIFTVSGNPQTGWGPWTTVSQGSTVPGGPITALVFEENRQLLVALFITDPNGAVYMATGIPNKEWSPWTIVSFETGKAKPGTPVTVFWNGNQFFLFIADINGNVLTTSSSLIPR